MSVNKPDDHSSEPVKPATQRPITESADKPHSDVAQQTQHGSPQALEEERLIAYARLLDSAIRLPGGFRIGLDGIVGLVPGIGDALGALMSGYLIYGASRLEIPRSVIVKMILNTLLETIVGAIPVFGDVFDFVFKANDRNARLMHAALDEKRDKSLH